jgi:hypothetical protein
LAFARVSHATSSIFVGTTLPRFWFGSLYNSGTMRKFQSETLPARRALACFDP